MAHKFFKAFFFFFFAHITFPRPALLFLEVKQEFDNLLFKHPTCVPSTASHDLFLIILIPYFHFHFQFFFLYFHFHFQYFSIFFLLLIHDISINFLSSLYIIVPSTTKLSIAKQILIYYKVSY